MTHDERKSRWPDGWLARALAPGCVLTVAVGLILAHEGHVPLPSRGARVNVETGHITLSKEARSALDVETAEINTTAAPPETILAYASLVTPWQSHAFAVSRLPGRIVALRARPGDRIAAGQVLAEVQSPDLELLRLEIQTARTEADLAEKVYRSLKGSTVPENTLLAAEVQTQQARNALELARVKWLALGLPQEGLDAVLSGTARATPGLPIRSPIAGTVIHADLALGKGVEAGEHLYEILDLSTLWVRIGLLEKDIPRLAPGQPITVQLTAYPGETFHGQIAIVGQYLNPETHLNDVYADLRLKEKEKEVRPPRLLPGMYGQARIELPAATGTRTLPATALVQDGVDRFVLVEEASASTVSEFRKKSVVVVREVADVVEVRSPELFPGDRVVTRGGHQLGRFFAPGVLRLTPESMRTIGLTVEPVTRQRVETVLEVPGAIDLSPERRSVATARLGGTIQSIRVDRSQRVETNAVLAEVFSLDLLNLQLDLLREQLATDLAEQHLARVRAAGDAIPKRRLVETETAFALAATRRDSLRRRLELAGLSREQLDALVKRREIAATLPVRATGAGRIVSFDRVIGQTVRADEPLFEIHDLARPWVQGFVSEQEIGRVQVGQSGRVRVVGHAGVLEGTVVRSGRTFGATHRTLSVWLELDRDRDLVAPLRRNQMARLTLVIKSDESHESHAPTLAVPITALVREAGGAFVFVQTGDTFARRAVTLGRCDDRFAEIVAGLREGESIAVTAVHELNTAWASVR